MRPVMRERRLDARAFTIVPLAIVLWLALLILGVLLYVKAPPAGYVPAKGVGPGQIGSVVLAVLYGGFWFIVIGRLAEKKGQTVANVTAAITLGLAIGMLTLSYFGLTKDQRGLAKAPAATAPAGGASTGTAGQGTTATGPDRMVQSMRDSAERSQRVMDEARQRDAERAQRQKEMMDRMRQATPPAPAGGAVPNAPASTTRPDVAPKPDPDQATINRVAGEFEKALNEETTAVAAALKPVLDTLVKQPRQDIREIKARIAAVEEVRGKVAELSKRLKNAGDDLGTALKAAGVGEMKASMEGNMRGGKAGWMGRSFAAGRVLDVLDKGKEEAELLRDNIGKWKYERDGKVSAKDPQLQSKINSARFFLDSDLKRRDAMLDELAGN